MYENGKSEIWAGLGLGIGIFEVLYLFEIKRPTKFPPVGVVAEQVDSSLALLACLARPGKAW